MDLRLDSLKFGLFIIVVGVEWEHLGGNPVSDSV